MPRKPPPTRWALDRRTGLTMVAGLALLTLATILAINGLRRVTQGGAEVARTQGILTEISRLAASALDLETGMRGYVLTGNPEYLEPYLAASEELPVELAALAALVHDARAAALVRAATGLVNRRMTAAEQAVAVRNAEGHAAAVAHITSGSGKALMDSMRGVLRELEGLEEELLRERLAALDRSQAALLRSMLFALLLALAAFGVALAQMQQSFRRRKLAEARAVESERRATAAQAAMAASKLEQSEARYHAVVEHSPDGVFINEDGRIVYANPACLRLFGADRPDQVLGQPPLRFIDPAHHATVRERIHLLQETGATVPFIEERWLRLDGTTVDMEVGAASIPYGDRRAIQVVLRDITARRRLEEQLRLAARMEAVGQLAGGVAHDFNNLLTVINGYSEGILRTLPPDHSAAPGLREIFQAGQHAAQLTRQLLAFGRRQMLEPQVMDPNQAIEATGRMLGRLIGEHIELSLNLTPHAHLVRIDPSQFQQVILNLAVNARDAMPSGGRLTIETHNTELDQAYARSHPEVTPGPHLMIAVSDTGVGMDEATRARVFEPFFTTKEKGHGTGLGLATVHGIVKQSGGHIWVYSEPGRGTTFKVYLQAADSSGTTRVSSPQDVVPARGIETILLVEDERSVRVVTRLTLESFGYRVIEASSGDEAMALAREAPETIDLVITDVVMPGRGGSEVAEELGRLIPGIRVLFLSGYTDDAVVRSGVLKAEASFLQKPFSAAALAAKVRSLLDAR